MEDKETREQFWARVDAELVEQELLLEDMKAELADLDRMHAEDILAGWYRDVAGIDD